jgi:hypothetical protein
MTIVRIVLFLTAIIGLSACKPQADSAFFLDPEKGNFTLEGKQGQYGPFEVLINGFNALQEGHLFQGSDSLVLISNREGLDLITVFKGSSEQASLIISVINPGDSSLEINSLEVTYLAGDDSKQGPYSFCGTGDHDALWQWLDGGPEAGTVCSLNLSGSSILLLPEERILLPPLRFFSHLCSDKAHP